MKICANRTFKSAYVANHSEMALPTTTPRDPDLSLPLRAAQRKIYASVQPAFLNRCRNNSATGLRLRFFKVTIATGHEGAGTCTGNALSSNTGNALSSNLAAVS